MDPILFVPLLSHSIFPEKLRKFFRCGVPEDQNLESDKSKYMDDLNKEIPEIVTDNGASYANKGFEEDKL